MKLRQQKKRNLTVEHDRIKVISNREVRQRRSNIYRYDWVCHINLRTLRNQIKRICIFKKEDLKEKEKDMEQKKKKRKNNRSMNKRPKNNRSKNRKAYFINRSVVIMKLLNKHRSFKFFQVTAIEYDSHFM